MATKTENKVSDKEQYVIDHIAECRKQAMDAALDRRKVWKEMWESYQNRQDNSMKQPWQSTVFAPKVWMKVEKASAEVKRAFLHINKLFKLALDERNQYEQEEKDELIKAMPEIETRFKRELEDSNLSNVYAEMAKSAFLLGIGLPKVLWDSDKEGLNYENAEALKTHISPDFKPFEEERPKYIVEDQEMDLATFRLMAKKVNESSGKKIYDMKKVDQIKEDFKSEDKDAENRKQKGLGQYKEVNKRVHLTLFWGDIVDKDGYEKEENVFCVVANKKYLVRKQANPFDHKNIPHVITFPIVFPHRGIAGVSLVEPTAKLLFVYNNLLNMYIDNMNFSVNKMFEMDPNRLLNAKTVMTLMPGKKIEKIGDAPVITVVEVPSIAKDAQPGLDTLNREMEEGTGVTEFIEGMPSKKAKTLGEVEIKTAESRGMFDTIARDLEQNSIKPLLERSYSLLVQFKDFPDIKGKYVFKVGGLSLMLMAKEMVEKITQVLGMALKSEVLGQMTDTDDLWKKYLGIMNLQDAYIEKEERVMPEQEGMEQEGQQGVQQKAAADAKRMVAQIPPEQLRKLKLG